MPFILVHALVIGPALMLAGSVALFLLRDKS